MDFRHKSLVAALLAIAVPVFAQQQATTPWAGQAPYGPRTASELT